MEDYILVEGKETVKKPNKTKTIKAKRNSKALEILAIMLGINPSSKNLEKRLRKKAKRFRRDFKNLERRSTDEKQGTTTRNKNRQSYK